MSAAETVAALKRCALKSANAADGRGAAGAVREARNTLQHLGHEQRAALQMAEAAGRHGQQLGHAARRTMGEIVAAMTGAPL